MSRVTVVIPLFNGERFIRETVDSLLRQTRRDLRIVCIDDASTDRSAEVVEAAGQGRVEVHRNERRLGLAGNWNRAVELCETPYLAIAHQDDVYEPTFVDTLARLLDDRPRAFAAHAKAITIDGQGRRTRDAAAIYKDRFWSQEEPQERDPADELRVLRVGNYVIAPAVMFRREAIDALGPFDIAFAFVTDWEYWIRAAMNGFTMVGTHARLVRFRRHDATATRQSELTMRRYVEERELLSRIAAIYPAPRPFAAMENTIISDFARRLAAGDREAAQRLATFAADTIPGFARSARAKLMALAIRGGKTGGRILQQAISARVEVAAAAHGIGGWLPKTWRHLV